MKIAGVEFPLDAVRAMQDALIGPTQVKKDTARVQDGKPIEFLRSCLAGHTDDADGHAVLAYALAIIQSQSQSQTTQKEETTMTDDHASLLRSILSRYPDVTVSARARRDTATGVLLFSVQIRNASGRTINERDADLARAIRRATVAMVAAEPSDEELARDFERVTK